MIAFLYFLLAGALVTLPSYSSMAADSHYQMYMTFAAFCAIGGFVAIARDWRDGRYS